METSLVSTLCRKKERFSAYNHEMILLDISIFISSLLGARVQTSSSTVWRALAHLALVTFSKYARQVSPVESDTTFDVWLDTQ